MPTRKKTIILGVTGHRNIAPNDKIICRTVRKECKSLLTQNEDCDYVILSGLAEGADRLVAKIAMDVLDAKLLSVLAVPQDEFMMDFGTPQSKRSFRVLLGKSASVITAPLLSRNAWREYTPSRNHQYAWEGAFLAEHCDILFALWDGKPARGIGGTAHVVSWFLKGKTPRKYEEKSQQFARSVGLNNRRSSAQRWLFHFEINQ